MTITESKLKILIIDDDAFQLEWISDVLSDQNYIVFTADNAKNAEGICNKEKLNLVITDVVMPDKDGIEMIMWLKEKDQTIPVLAISGGGKIDGATYLESAKLLGADKIMTKPLVADQLMSTVTEMLK